MNTYKVGDRVTLTTKAKKKQTPAQLAASIKRRNAAFAKLSKAEKRVAIAKDVLAQLAAKKIVAERGTYFDYPGLHGSSGEDEKKELQDVLCATGAPKCHACALGGVFASAVRHADKITVSDYLNSAGAAGERGTLHAYLGPWFSLAQLCDIEAAFELGTGFSYGPDGKQIKGTNPFAAADFGRRYSLSTARMKAIMQNIIDNKGTFKPAAAKEKR